MVLPRPVQDILTILVLTILISLPIATLVLLILSYTLNWPSSIKDFLWSLNAPLFLLEIILFVGILCSPRNIFKKMRQLLCCCKVCRRYNDRFSSSNSRTTASPIDGFNEPTQDSNNSLPPSYYDQLSSSNASSYDSHYYRPRNTVERVISLPGWSERDPNNELVKNDSFKENLPTYDESVEYCCDEVIEK